MRTSSDAHPHSKEPYKRSDRVAAVDNAYAVATGMAEASPDDDEYAKQFADHIAQRVLDALLPKIEAIHKLGRAATLTSDVPAQAEQLLTDNEVASLFKVSKQTIWRWIKTSDGFPKPLKVEKGSTRWRLSEVVEYEARVAGER